METFIDFLLNFTSSWGYWGVFVLMALESSFIPFPSEIVIPPAAYLAQQGQMNIYLVVIFGVLGSLVGALINYFLALKLGRPLVYRLCDRRFARFLLLSREKLQRAEEYFLKYGGLSTFVGRLLPAIRQLISLPAGFVQMPLGKFLFYTGLGAGIWVVVLALQGYLIGVYREFFISYLYEVILGLLLVFVSGYFLVKYLRTRRKKT